MGNSSSQVVQLRTPYGPPGNDRGSRNRKLNKYVSAENRVLPIPVAGQRLRQTDNGNILQNGGTISGRKLALIQAQQNNSASETDFAGALKRTRGRQEEAGRDTLYGHRKSHSDPDIVRSMHQNSLADEDSSGSGGPTHLRSIIAESPSKAKIRWRKKGRAPDPPPSLSSTLPRELDRMPLYDENVGKARSRSKSPAPLPPSPPAPPPPLQDTQPVVGYEKNRRWKPLDNSFLTRSEMLRKSFGDVEAGNHQKNGVPPAQNKSFNSKMDAKAVNKPLNRSFQEEILAAARKKSQSLKQQVLSIGNKEEILYKGPQRNNDSNRNLSVWDKNVASKEIIKKVPGNKNAKPDSPSLNKQPQQRNRSPPEKKNSKHKEEVVSRNRSEALSKDKVGGRTGESRQAEPKRYFFSNVIKKETKPEAAKITPSEMYYPEGQNQNNLNQPDESQEWSMQPSNNYRVIVPPRETTKELSKEVSREVQQNQFREQVAQEVSRELWLSENRSYRGSSRSSRFSSGSSSSDKDEDEEAKAIGVHLRPVLPRKPVAMPQFSPLQAWKNIVVETPSYCSSDVSGSSSSDEADGIEEEVITKVHRPVAPRRSFPERCADSGISPDAGSPLPVHEVMPRRRPGVGRAATPPDELMHWTPQQDLLDDSDLGSIQDLQGRRWLEPPVLSLHAKLTLPNTMFVNRQLESALPPIKLEEKVSKSRNRKRNNNNKQNPSDSNQQFNSLRSLKKVLRLRSKSMEEATRGLDSNWSLSKSTPTIAAPEAVPKIYKDLQRSPSESALNQDVRPLREDLRNEMAEEDHAMFLQEMQSSHDPEQDSIANMKSKKTKKGSKFSYQNTFRREAKKKLEEKVTREAVEKERRREEEIQWMNKVEDEFRKRRDREKINIRYQLKMLSDEDTALDSSGDWRAQSPLLEPRSLPYVPSCKTKESNPESAHLYTTSSTSASSPDIHPLWNNKQPTGMSKWLKKQPTALQRPTYTRPEPEGGRSSGDEFKPHENIHHLEVLDSKSKKNSDNYNQHRVACDQFSFGEVPAHYKEEKSKSSKQEVFDRSSQDLDAKVAKISNRQSANQVYKSDESSAVHDDNNALNSNHLQHSSIVSSDTSLPNAGVSPIHDAFSPVKKKKPNIYKQLSSLAEREDQYLHYNSNDPHSEPSNPVPNHLTFSTKGFQSELLARVQVKNGSTSPQDNFSRGHPHRSGSRLPRPITTTSQAVSGSSPGQNQQRNGKGPVLQLTPVTPFNPSKGYRPVPFDLVVTPAKHRSQNSSSPLCTDSRNLRTAVEAR